MTIASEISRLQTAKADIKLAIENKWVSVPSSEKLDVYDDYISQIKNYDWPYVYYDYLNSRWPCPMGYHVPSYNDFVNLHNIWISLGAWGDWWAWENALLKIPLVWYRDAANSNVYEQGSLWLYWTYNAYSNQARHMSYTTWWVTLNRIIYRWTGTPLRPFKNFAEVPTSSWTKLYGTSIESWWIFWDSSAWLISLSSDWQTWVTIADKNLWATQVWNSWDTLTQANMGNMYQWWNNYWFPSTWSVNTTTTKVDASIYWPLNYYIGNLFIRSSSSPYDWSSAQNDSLRWWATWAVQSEYITVNWTKYLKYQTSN